MQKALDQEGEVEPRLEIVEQNLPRHRSNRRDRVGHCVLEWSLRVVEIPRSAASKLKSQASPGLSSPPLSASFALEGTHHKGGPLVSQSQSIVAGRATLWPRKGVVKIIHIKARQEAENKARTPRGHNHEDPPPTASASQTAAPEGSTSSWKSSSS